MPVKIISGNLFEKNETGKSCFLVHQVNCRGVMGAGLAKTIKQRYPNVYAEYMNALDNRAAHLGTAQTVFVNDQIIKVMYVVNLFGQDDYGRDKQYTSYLALEEGFSNLNNAIKRMLYTPDRVLIRIPYKMGCGLGGGNWNKVLSIIKNEFGNSQYEVNIMNGKILQQE